MGQTEQPTLETLCLESSVTTGTEDWCSRVSLSNIAAAVLTVDVTSQGNFLLNRVTDLVPSMMAYEYHRPDHL